MNLNFNSVFGQRIVSRIIRRIAKKKFGCDVDVQISDLQLYETADERKRPKRAKSCRSS